MNKEKIISTFIASSIVEFREERDFLRSELSDINLKYLDSPLQFRFFFCEEEGGAVSLEGSQNIINEKIKACDLFVVLFGQKLGNVTCEEVILAVEERQKKGTPDILICFKGKPSGAVYGWFSDNQPELLENSVSFFDEEELCRVIHDRLNSRYKV